MEAKTWVQQKYHIADFDYKILYCEDYCLLGGDIV
jgi:hypothetical protein